MSIKSSKVNSLRNKDYNLFTLDPSIIRNKAKNLKVNKLRARSFSLKHQVSTDMSPMNQPRTRNHPPFGLTHKMASEV